MPLKPSSVRSRRSDGTVSDRDLHESILSGVDDTSLRVRSAQRMLALGFTPAEVEELFNVKLPSNRAAQGE